LLVEYGGVVLHGSDGHVRDPSRAGRNHRLPDPAASALSLGGNRIRRDIGEHLKRQASRILRCWGMAINRWIRLRRALIRSESFEPLHLALVASDLPVVDAELGRGRGRFGPPGISGRLGPAARDRAPTRYRRWSARVWCNLSQCRHLLSPILICPFRSLLKIWIGRGSSAWKT
jgi:hypothetical protein